MGREKRWLQVVPAYGKRYLSNELLRAAWDAGVDFQIEADMASPDLRGRYMSRRDLDENAGGVRDRFAGVQIVQAKEFHQIPDGRLLRIPYLTEEVTW